jgi:hypothetical protein
VVVLILSPRGHLPISGDFFFVVTAQGEGLCYQHLVGGHQDQGCCSASCSTQDNSLITNTYSAPNVSSANGQKTLLCSLSIVYNLGLSALLGLVSGYCVF